MWKQGWPLNYSASFSSVSREDVPRIQEASFLLKMSERRGIRRWKGTRNIFRKKHVSIESLMKAGSEGWETGEEDPGRLSEDIGAHGYDLGERKSLENNSESHMASNRAAAQGSRKVRYTGRQAL